MPRQTPVHFVFTKACKMAWRMDEIETLRIKYKPKCITTLFVGESAPVGGDFFYSDKKTRFRTNIEEAIKLAGLRGTGDFLEEFKGYGWYLDDLVVDSAIDKHKGLERREARSGAAPCLTRRLVRYRPRAVVSLMLGFAEIVKSCVESAGHQIESPLKFYAVPFPGMSHQIKFRKQMKEILTHLPKSSNCG